MNNIDRFCDRRLALRDIYHSHTLSRTRKPLPNTTAPSLRGHQHPLDAGTSPSKLILADDLAGGNLALHIIAHQLQPTHRSPRLLWCRCAWAGCCCSRRGWSSEPTRRRTRANEAHDVLPPCTYWLFDRLRDALSGTGAPCAPRAVVCDGTRVVGRNVRLGSARARYCWGV